MNKISTTDWILKAQKTHGDIYDYSKTVYINSATKVEIVCKIHGSFFQNPSNHLKGSGCPACSGNTKVDNSLFIERARKAHGNKYDYSLTDYKKMHSRVKIICPEHGVFEQEPNLHLRGAGCPGCSRNKKLDTEKFKQKARLIHGNKYNYDLVEYVNAKIPISIVCSEHGVFLQDPYNHLKGRGCAKCAADINGRRKRLSRDDKKKELCNEHGIKILYFARKQDVPGDWDRYKVFTDCKEMIESLIKECKIETSI